MHTSDKATLTVFLFKWGSNINCSAKQAGNSAVDSGVSNDSPKGIPCADNNRTAFEDWEEIFNYFSHTKNMHRISIYVYIYIYLYRCNHPLFFSFFLHKPMNMQYKMCQAMLAIAVVHATQVARTCDQHLGFSRSTQSTLAWADIQKTFSLPGMTRKTLPPLTFFSLSFQWHMKQTHPVVLNTFRHKVPCGHNARFVHGPYDGHGETCHNKCITSYKNLT